MINNLNQQQQLLYNKYLEQTQANGGTADVSSTQLFWKADGSLVAKEADGDVFTITTDDVKGAKETDDTAKTNDTSSTTSSGGKLRC